MSSIVSPVQVLLVPRCLWLNLNFTKIYKVCPPSNPTGKSNYCQEHWEQFGNLNVDWQLGILRYITVVKWNYIGKCIDFIKVCIEPHLAPKLSLSIYFRKFQQKLNKQI